MTSRPDNPDFTLEVLADTFAMARDTTFSGHDSRVTRHMPNTTCGRCGADLGIIVVEPGKAEQLVESHRATGGCVTK